MFPNPKYDLIKRTQRFQRIGLTKRLQFTHVTDMRPLGWTLMMNIEGRAALTQVVPDNQNGNDQ